MGDTFEMHPPNLDAIHRIETTQDVDPGVEYIDKSLEAGELTLEEDMAGGMSRHLGVFSTTLLIVGRIIGTGIFSTPTSITNSTDSVGAAFMMWLLNFAISIAGLFV
ncbi:hypothetical protein BDV96DRAFT_655256 [Lophiotrema nucula]|uniref:Uncharacterized protein n=1 Tax=Lophiotrema nucula TaxID=690887 RepID=A0A6A5YG41_9PLEO|nr:hypothetical protein BDV96DRAFT_655256 [Lophiotrema nucula]